MAVIFQGNSIVGTVDGDIILGQDSGSQSGGGGNDLIVGDFGNLVTTHGITRATAANIDDAAYWTTSSHPLGSDAGGSGTTLLARPTAGTAMWYAVTVGAGETITIDVDSWFNRIDTVVALLDANGTLIASNDDGALDDDGYWFDGEHWVTAPPDVGGTFNFDSYLTRTLATAGTYYIRILEYGGSYLFEGGEEFLVNVSVTGHAAGPAPTEGLNDTISGDAGNDQLLGGDGSDSLLGGEGGDTLDGGAGIDTMLGGAGSDIYHVDNIGDEVAETTALGSGTDAGGIDFVISSASFSLASDGGRAFIENLELVGTADISATGNDLNNRVQGNRGNNLIVGGGGNDTVTGGFGNDTLDGGDGADSLSGGFGNDLVLGGGGNDTLDDLTGIDTLIGGAGSDFYYVSSSAAVVIETTAPGGAVDSGGYDTVVSTASYSLERPNGGLSLIEALLLQGYSDISATGDDANNRIEGNRGSNFLVGGGGNDTIDGGNDRGSDTLDGGRGNDSLRGGHGWDSLLGGDGDDTMSGGGGNDWLDGGAGNDTIDGGFEDDALLGGDGTDLLTGGGGNDSLDGDSGSDSLDGGVGDDTVRGGDGADVLNGGSGRGQLEGGAGNDVLSGGLHDDVLDGGTGADEMAGGAGSDSYIVDDVQDMVSEVLAGSAATNAGGIDVVIASVEYSIASSINGRQFIEQLTLTGTGDIAGTGNDLDNRLNGNSGDNVLVGGLGFDTIVGGLGDDSLYGGAGRDVLRGGAGLEVLSGGGSRDVFVFDNGDVAQSSMSRADRITDFVSASDLIDLHLVDADRTAAGDQPFAFIGSAAFSGVAGQLRFELAGGNTFVLGDRNGDAVADWAIRLDGAVTLVAADFVL